MPGPSVTYTFSNGTTADASQVNTNFTDLINGSTDGTKDYIINTLECNGNASLEGNVTLGNGTVDDITISGSLASTINIKTTFSYDIGTSTIGLRDIYLGDAGSAARTTKIRGGTVASSWTLTLPTSGGAAGSTLETDGSGVTSWAAPGPDKVTNYSISCAAGSSALTVSLKDSTGSDPSSTSPVRIAFRSSTAGTGTTTIRSVTSALSLTISSGSTLGHASGQNEYIYIYAYDVSGTIKLAASSIRSWDEGSLQSTTSEGGAGASDSKTVLYGPAGDSNVPVRLIARLKSNQVTAGTWASVPTEISLFSSDRDLAQNHYVTVHTGNGHGATNTRIRRFTTTADNVGSAITYADSANDGGSFTINADGIYAITYTDGGTTSGAYFGLSRNSNQLTTALTSITVGHRLTTTNHGATYDTCTWVGRLVAGDVIRAHDDDVNTDQTTAVVKISVAKIGS